MNASRLPLSQSWQVTVDLGEEVDGLPKLVLPEGMNSKSAVFAIYFRALAIFLCLTF